MFSGLRPFANTLGGHVKTFAEGSCDSKQATGRQPCVHGYTGALREAAAASSPGARIEEIRKHFGPQSWGTSYLAHQNSALRAGVPITWPTRISALRAGVPRSYGPPEGPQSWGTNYLAHQKGLVAARRSAHATGRRCEERRCEEMRCEAMRCEH